MILDIYLLSLQLNEAASGTWCAILSSKPPSISLKCLPESIGELEDLNSLEPSAVAVEA